MKINKKEVKEAQWAYGKLGACRKAGNRKNNIFRKT